MTTSLGKLRSTSLRGGKPGRGLQALSPWRVVSGGVLPFDPMSLFPVGQLGAWYDTSDLSTLFQDSAGTVPVTADGDPVGMMKDKSGNGYHVIQATAALRPTYRTGGLTRWLESDGTRFLIASVPSFNARSSVLMAACYFNDLTWQTASAVMSLGNSVNVTPYFALLDNGTTWVATARSDGNVSQPSTTIDNTGDLRNGRVLTGRSAPASLVLDVDGNSLPSPGGIASTSITCDQIGVLVNARNAPSSIARSRYYGGLVMLGTMADKAIGQMTSYLQAKLSFWSDIVGKFTNGFIAVPSVPYARIGNQWYLDAMGSTTLNTASLPDAVTGPDLGGVYGVNRFSVVADPDNPSKRSLRLVLNRNDPDTGAKPGETKKRIETSFQTRESSKLSYGSRHIMAYMFRPGESWAGTDATDNYDPSGATGDYSVLFQMHAGEGVPQSPYFSVVAVNNKAYFQFMWDSAGYANPTRVTSAGFPILPGWNELEVEIVPDFQGISGGMLKVLFNGVTVIDYVGPIGFNTSSISGSPLGYPKIGIYKALERQQTWDNVLTRSVFMKGVLGRKSNTATTGELLAMLRKL